MSTGLFETELQFQRLLKLIKSPATTGIKLLSVSDFLYDLLNRSDQKKFLSYYLDLGPYILGLLLKKEKIFLSPKTIDKLIFINKKLSEITHFGKEASREKFFNAGVILNDYKNNIFKPEKEELASDSIAIVLIENCGEDAKTDCKYGLIQKFKLNSLIQKGKEKVNKIEFRNILDSNQSEIDKYLYDIISLAEQKCKNERLKTHNYHYIFYFDSHEFIYTGTSFGIGALCLAYNSILINEFNKYYYNFKSNCVFSGEIDRDGNLLKLNRKLLKIKLETVFFSGYKIFIIPEDNIVEAKEELGALQNNYPERKLDLIPISNYKSIFDNTNIVEKIKLSPTKKTLKFYKNFSKPINISMTIIFIVTVLSYLVFYLIPNLDENPVSYNYSNNRYITYNKYGLEIWRSEPLNPLNKSFYSENNEGQRCILTDVNEDGINELLYVVYDLENIQNSHTIFCSNEDIKNFPIILPIKELKYPNDPIHNYLYYIKNIFLLDCNGDNKKEILYIGRHTQYYPAVVGAVDFSGKHLGEFWNEGHPSLTKIIDINNDGRPYIFFCGCNNRDSLECAALIVIDPKYLQGASPYSDPISTNKPGFEKYYILFPKSVLLENTKKERNEVYELNINSDKTITCWTSEGNNVTDEAVLYDFDNEMNLIQINCNDQFKNSYEKLRNQKNDLPDLLSYLEDLGKKIRWWNGEAFVNYSAINKYYLEAKK